MQEDWDQRAVENARHYVATSQDDWSDGDFFRLGEQSVDEFVRSDMQNICWGRQPQGMRVLEIGCGAGRVTRALSSLFGEVHAVDVSSKMVDCAREALADRPNVFVYQNYGMDLRCLPSLTFDFAFSMLVFQHIPAREVIESYVRETSRVLCQGALFKFQVQGDLSIADRPHDTWLGMPVSESDARTKADRTGFELRYQVGQGEPDYWLWFFKQ